MRYPRPRLNLFAVVNRLDELRRHRAAFQPFAPQGVNYGARQISVKPDARHKRALETIPGRALVTVNFVRVICAVIFSDHFVTRQLLSDLESAHFFPLKMGLIGLMGLMCLLVCLTPCSLVSQSPWVLLRRIKQGQLTAGMPEHHVIVF